jgi:hypothetical protein
MSGSHGGITSAIGFIFTIIIWLLISQYWNSRESVVLRNPIITRFARLYISIFIAIAISLFFTTDSQTVGLTAMWRIFLVGAVVGAVFILAPVVRSERFEYLRVETTFAASTLWFLTFGIGNSILIQDDSDRIPIIMTFFIILTAALALRWNFEQYRAYFVGSVLSGSAAVVTFSNQYILDAFDEPEAVTLPLALWLLTAFAVLQKRSDQTLPSFLTWGLPLCVAIIPSAAVAVALVDVNEVSSTTAWVRFWVVLAISIALTVSGARLKVTGLLVPGAISFALVAFPQIWVQLSLIIPRWVFFAILGALLITIAARFEYIQKISKASSSWFEKLK